MGDKIQVDVLILGAGPAGLMAAAWMAQTGIRTLLVEQRPHGTQNGRADGLESRTLEILDSFGLADKIWGEANHTVEIALWSESDAGVLRREGISANTEPGWSRFYESTLGQGRVEEHLLDFIQSTRHVNIRRATIPTSLNIDYDAVEDHNTYPIQVQLDEVAPSAFPTPADSRPGGQPGTPNSESSMTLNSDDSGVGGMGMVVEAKFLLGCDGAHSWLRKQLGVQLEGESSGDHWGVLDIVPITNFPDIRKRFIVKSRFGTLMMVPRERRLVRVYVELSPMASAHFTEQQTPMTIMNQVSEIMQPYVVKSNHIDWFTTYKVGQRLCPKVSFHNRIFLAGDAIHTHSPKAGQGMNVSMQDTYNLGWKLASVIRGVSPPGILETYAQERLPIAQRLLQLDQRICRGMCRREGIDLASRGKFAEDHKRAIREENTWASGLTATYQPNRLISQAAEATGFNSTFFASKPHLAEAINLGARIPSRLVLRQSDSQAYHLQQIFRSTGQWNLIIFGGNISETEQMARLHRLADTLSHPESYFQRLSKASAVKEGLGSVGTFLLHSADRNSIDIFNLPYIFRPCYEDGSIDYNRVLVDNESYHHPGGGELYKSFGIDPQGCMVLLRPDQHVAFLSSMDDVHGLQGFLSTVICL
ncbi:hypothetical protein BBP40_001315 [Aspergillus hancockii]|nr:hypothetical protein BBP40_001315 [Aspergillus hancockii]